MGEVGSSQVLIVGCGYVGMALGKALVSRGVRVRGTTTTLQRCDEISACGIEPIVLEVCDRDAVCAAAQGCDAIYLCAGAGRSRPYGEVYVPAADAVVAAIQSAGVRRAIYTSSTGVYAQDDGKWVDEDSPAAPTTDHGRILLDAERILLDQPRLGDGFEGAMVSVIRLGGIYGPGRELVHFVQRAAGTTRSDGDGYVNMVHLDDICEVFISLLDESHHGVLNLCDDRPVTRREFYDSIVAECSLPAINWVPPDNDSLGKRVCNQRIKERLGISLKHPAHC